MGVLIGTLCMDENRIWGRGGLWRYEGPESCLGRSVIEGRWFFGEGDGEEWCVTDFF